MFDLSIYLYIHLAIYIHISISIYLSISIDVYLYPMYISTFAHMSNRGDCVVKVGPRVAVHVISIHLSVYLPSYLYPYIYIYLSIPIDVYLYPMYISTSSRLSNGGDRVIKVGPSVAVHVISFYPSISISSYLSLYLSICLSVYLYLYLSISICISTVPRQPNQRGQIGPRIAVHVLSIYVFV